ncbi:MAG: SHOCT-like domain-containing protein [Bacillota bacterium]
MSDERLQILKMVEEGKVSAEEATKLLDALGNGTKVLKGPKATHVRVHVVDGRSISDFSIGVGLARWVLSLPVINLEFGNVRLDADQLVRFIEGGATGKVMEFTEGTKKLEIWLDP